MAERRFAAQWDKYESTTLRPANAGPVQVQETRRAFYAGGLTLFSTILSALSEGEEPSEQDLRVLDDLKAEFEAWQRDLAQGPRVMDRPARKCNGKTNPKRTHTGCSPCGKDATVVSTAPDGLQWFSCDDPEHQAEKTAEGLQWFACETLEHQEGADTVSIEQWFEEALARWACDILGR